MKMLQNNYFHKAKELKCFCLSLFILFSGPIWAQAQLADKIYLVNETSIGNVEIFDVGKRKVKVRNQEGKELGFKVKEILMAFNEDGQYITFPHSPQQLNDFLSPKEKDAEVDLIITLSGKMIPARINSENSAEINYQDVAKDKSDKNLSTTEIAAIIYKDGDHKLFASPSRVSEVLAQLEGKVAEARLASYGRLEKAATNPFAAGDAAAKREKKEAKTVTQAAAPKEANLEAAADIDPEAYSRKALQKTAELGTYLGIILDRTNSMAEANKAVELAVKLFIDENAQVEVSSTDGRDRYKVRAYLNRLKLLKYDKIEITWTDISYVSDLKKGIDGNYYGVITLQQRFKGFIDNEVVYGDLTEKNIEVMMVPYQKETDGEQKQKWDVFLSDVGVVVTKFDQ